MKKFATPFIFGFIAGIILTGLCVWIVMPKMMVNVYESKLGFDETVTAVENAVTNFESWKTPQTFNIGQNSRNAGFKEMTDVKIVSLCQPEYAYRILKNDKDKMVSSMMPLGIGICETNDGKVIITEMNIGLMGKMFGGNISKVMGEASNDIIVMLKDIIKD